MTGDVSAGRAHLVTMSLARIIGIAVAIIGCGDVQFDTVARDGAVDGALPDAQPDGGSVDAAPDGFVQDAALGDAGPSAGALLSESFGPLVRYEFEGAGVVVMVEDDSARAPSVPLAPEGMFPGELRYLDGAVELTSARLAASVEASTALRDALVVSGSFSAEVWASTRFLAQTGPARIMTFSESSSDRAFTFGQVGSTLNVRVVSTLTGRNGHPFDSTVVAFPETDGTPRHLVVSFDGPSATQTVYVDGGLASRTIHTEGLVFGALSAWSSTDSRLGFGDEFGRDRRWTGAVHRAAVYDRVLSAEEVNALFLEGP